MCASCGTKQKGSTIINRRCPEPDTINSYLQENSAGDHKVTSDDYICLTCYKYFRDILTKTQQAQVHPIQKKIDHHSLAKVKSCIHIHVATQINTNGQQNLNLNDYFELSVCFTAQHIADYIEIDQVMLFPDIYNGFKERVSTKSQTYTCIDTVQDKDMHSKRWLLARIHNFFNNMLI